MDQNKIKNQEFYNLSATSIEGREIKMEKYKDKYILIVNTASKCGLTPQFEGLQKLYEKYKDKGFVVLGFPCNQFANQEPGDKESITNVCQVNYGVDFQMFDKVEVNGDNAHPIFKYLKSKLKYLFFFSKVRWNFEKFLVDREGYPIKRFSPVTTPEQIDNYLSGVIN